MQIYEEIFQLVHQVSSSPGLHALALKSIGKEPNREGHHQEAVEYLEEARDAAMEGSKLLRAFIHSYLIRALGTASLDCSLCSRETSRGRAGRTSFSLSRKKSEMATAKATTLESMFMAIGKGVEG